MPSFLENRSVIPHFDKLLLNIREESVIKRVYHVAVGDLNYTVEEGYLDNGPMTRFLRR
jgi:hypothetical protein